MIRFDAPKFPRKNKGRLLVISRKKGERERGDELKDSGCDSHWALADQIQRAILVREREREQKKENSFSFT